MVTSAALLVRMGARYIRLLRSQFESERIRRRRIHARLAAVLAAAGRIPFYRERFGGNLAPEDFIRLPVLERRGIGDLNRSVRSLHSLATRFLADRSSGSTGLPAEFLFDHTHQAGRFAARTRYLTQNGWSPLKRTAWILPLPENTPDGKLMRDRRLLGSRFLSIFTPPATQLQWLREFTPRFLYTLPSNFESLARELQRRGDRLTGLELAFSGGEVLEPAQRHLVRETMGVEIRDNYGSTEGFCAWQCPHGAYHINAEHMLVEVLDERGRPQPPGRIGRIVITTLENRLMPLIRYAIGDLGALAEPGICPCGRTLPLLHSVLGRSINMFRLENGRRVSPWELVVKLKYLPDIVQFQIVQKTTQRYVFRFRADDGFDERGRNSVRNVFRELLGAGVEVSFEPAAVIERSASGKFMTAVSEVP
ncbi:phenylacetate--CoA ligase family protein [bacterium]|nr:phenylacetate--CoA ligase family protein [candidate division CSSED10-310 bacterium]